MTARILAGDAAERLRELPSGSVHCVVTSPPYWGLRKYRAGEQELGSEATPQEHLARLVAVFQEVRRVLRDDGTLWCNYGDAMPAGELTGLPERLVLALQADGWTWRSTVVWAKPAPMPESVSGTRWEQHRVKVTPRTWTDDGTHRGDKHHSDIRVSETQARWAPCPGCPACAPNDGLVLRRGSWRPTRAWEPIFMLVKGGQYYGDGESVREPNLEPWRSNGKRDVHRHHEENGLVVGRAQAKGGFNDQLERHGRHYNPLGHNPRNVWVIPPEPCNWDFCLACGTWYGKGGWQRKSIKRWTTKELDIETEEYRTVQHRRCANCKAVDEFVDHYAAFPSELPRRCIAASTSEKGVCPACRAPWARVIEKPEAPSSLFTKTAPVVEDVNVRRGFTSNTEKRGSGQKYQNWLNDNPMQTLGWRATCSCAAGEPVPATVLDPFMGSGTTLLAAARLGRDAIGIELSPRYVALAQERLRADAPLLTQ